MSTKSTEAPPKVVVEEVQDEAEDEQEEGAEGVEGGGGGVEVGFGEKAPKKRSKHIRKKKRKGTGFEVGKQESAPHQADINRYDVNLPFDQRLLRAIDEYRNLRGFNQDTRLIFTSILIHFKIDVKSLRSKYGKQSLRGVSFEDGEKDKKPKEGGKGGGGDDDDDDEEEVGILTNEEDWAKEVLSSQAIAKWIQDRANDRCSPYLTIAPLIMFNFLTFLLTRNVLPMEESQIESVVPIASIAKVQLPNSVSIFNSLLHDPLHSALRTVFSSPESTLTSPIDPSEISSLLTPKANEPHSRKLLKNQEAGVGGEDDKLPGVISLASGDFLEGTTEMEEKDLNRDTTELNLPSSTSTSEIIDADANWKGDVESSNSNTTRDPIKMAQKIQKDLEEEIKKIQSWSLPIPNYKLLTEIIKFEFERLGYENSSTLDLVGGEKVSHCGGIWRVGNWERSARSIIGWEKVEGLKKVSGENPSISLAQRDQNGQESPEDKAAAASIPADLYRLILSPHHSDFPLTTKLIPPPLSTLEAEKESTVPPVLGIHSLQDEINILVPASYHKFFTNNLVLEADFRQIIFYPSTTSTSINSSSTTSISKSNESHLSSTQVGNQQQQQKKEFLWIVEKIYRVLPSYYKHIGEDLREEPDRTLSYKFPPVSEVVSVVGNEEGENVEKQDELQVPGVDVEKVEGLEEAKVVGGWGEEEDGKFVELNEKEEGGEKIEVVEEEKVDTKPEGEEVVEG